MQEQHKTKSPLSQGLSFNHGSRLMKAWAIALVLSALSFCASASPPQSLNQALSRMADELAVKADLADKTLLIRTGDLYELGTEHSLPLALVIQERLVLELNSRGVHILFPGVDALPEYLLQGQWHTQDDKLDLTLNLVRFGPGTPEILASVNGAISLATIPRHLLKPDLATWGRYLVRKLETQSTDRPQLTVHLIPFQIRDAARPRELGEYLSDWLRPALGASLAFQPIDVPLALDRLGAEQLRTRGLSKSLAGTGGAELSDAQFDAEGLSLTGDLVAAEAELIGKAYLRPNSLELRVHIRDDRGIQVAAADMELAKRLLPANLLAARGGTGDEVALSRNGLELELSTTHGEARAVYGNAERIRFILRINRDAYLYLFNRDSRGRTSLLYPLPGAPKTPMTAGRPLILPDDGLPYELVVQPPFGEDHVWAVAAEDQLRLPKAGDGQWDDFQALKRGLRRQTANTGRGYAEAGQNIVTEP